jgi:DnaJ-class molecular chaperone
MGIQVCCNKCGGRGRLRHLIVHKIDIGVTVANYIWDKNKCQKCKGKGYIELNRIRFKKLYNKYKGEL